MGFAAWLAIFKPKNKSPSHSLSFWNKLTLFSFKNLCGAGKIRQNMPDLRDFDISGEPSGRRTPPLLFWGFGIQKKGFFWSFLGTKRSFIVYFVPIGRYIGVQHCSAVPPQSTQKYPKIGRIPGSLMVWEKDQMEGTPQSLFWGQRIRGKGERWAKILYTQVHWCAALFCRTIPEQAKISLQAPPPWLVFS